MKKNKMMRNTAALGVAVLLTASVLSGTLAKYTTSVTGKDEARVAKFGVVITESGAMFADEYETDDTSVIGTIAKSVVTSGKTGDAVVAPGTTGELVNATISGTPEVAVRVQYEPTLTLTGWKAEDNSEYCPIVITVGDKTYGLTGMKDINGIAVTNAANSVAELKTTVENDIKAYSKSYAPNTDLSTIGTNGYVHASWNWAFENDDEKDTYLGKLAADADESNDSKIELALKTTVSQID